LKVTGKGSEYSVEIKQFTGMDGLQPMLKDWKRFLDDKTVRCGVWCDPEVVSEIVAFDEGERLVTATVFRGNDRVAIVPFRLRSRSIPLSLGLWVLASIKARVMRLCDFDFAIRPGTDRLAVLLGVFAAIRREVECDIIVGPNCPVDGLGYVLKDDKTALRRLVVRNIQPTFLVQMPTTFERYLSALSTNTRQMLRRKVRKMRRECGAPLSTRCFRNVADMDELLPHLTSVWRTSWHGKLQRHDPPSISFLRKIAARGMIRSYVLFVGDQPAASIFGLQYRGKFLDESPAYDDRWRMYSPGLVLNYFVLEDLFAIDSPSVVDFGFGYNQYKETLGTEREVRGVLSLPVSVRGHMVAAAEGLCGLAYRAGKFVLGRYGVVTKIKARMRNASVSGRR